MSYYPPASGPPNPYGYGSQAPPQHPPPPPGGYSSGYQQPPPHPSYGQNYAYPPSVNHNHPLPPPPPPPPPPPHHPASHPSSAYSAPPSQYGGQQYSQHAPHIGHTQYGAPHQYGAAQQGSFPPSYALAPSSAPPPPVYNPQQNAYGYAQTPQAIPMTRRGRFGLPVVNGGHVADYAQTFKVEESLGSATRDSFSIKDGNGFLRYKVSGSLTVNERKTMVDAHGRTILKIKESRLQVREKITISDSSNTPLLTIQQTGMAQFGSKNAKAYLGAHCSGNPVFSVNANKSATVFRVTDPSGVELAVINRKANSLKRKLTGQDSYETTVMPGVDQALMCMVTVACDEIWCD